jgi:single-stranded-DNA-specific exonuclease
MKLIERPVNTAVKQALSRQLPDWLADIMARRLECPIAAETLLQSGLGQLPNPNGLPDMGVAVNLLTSVIAQQQRILCVVDYDTDGISSGAILLEGLTALGATVDVMVTNRHEDGYGFSVGACQRVMKLDPLPDCLITADLGSSDGTQFAKLQQYYASQNKPLVIIVTDHHHISSTTPPSSVDAFINPHRQDTDHDYRHPICGAMVAWNLIAALRAHGRQQTDLSDLQAKATTFDVKHLLDLAAIATIGDMVDLSNPVNRTVVRVGLARMNQRLRPAWQLLKEALDSSASIDEETVGFQISPRINALSRMGDDGHTALTWLTTAHMSSCQQAWASMSQNNEERKEEQALCESLALQQAEQQIQQQRFILIAYVPEASHGVVGLAAGRLAQRFGRPALVFSQCDKGQLTGSARSIAGYDIRALLEAVQQSTDCIRKYGGHAAAAGLSIAPENLSLLTDALERQIRADFNEQAPEAHHYYDGHLPSALLSLEGVQQLKQLSPFGQGLPAPSFMLDTLVLNHSSMGKTGQHKRLTLQTLTNSTLEAVWFNADQSLALNSQQRYRCVVQVSINHFRGQAKLQAMIQTLTAH